MSTAKQQFLTPVGRLVQGDPFEAQTKNMQGQPLLTRDNRPTQKFMVAVAFRKDDPQFSALYGLMSTAARTGFPQLFDAQGRCTRMDFAWKLVDGDSNVPDQSGRAPNTKEGFPGHWVVRFQSSFPPRCFYAGRYAPHEQIQDANVIRRGYFVRVSGTIEPNMNPQKPGVYVNLGMVELVAQGPEIVSGPDASAVFGGTPAGALPPGATAFPATGAAGMPAGALPATGAAGMPNFPGVGGAAYVAPMAPVAPPPMMPGMQPAIPGLPAPVGAVAPNPQFLGGPQPPMAPTAPPMAPAGPQLTPAALAAWPAGTTLAAWQAGGWSEAQMRQAGYLA